MNDRDRIVFHGSSFPPGTPSTKLRPPRLAQPFFVADNPAAAINYARESGYAETPSIFVFRTRQPIKKMAFNFEDKTHINKLKSKLPKTMGFLQKFFDGETMDASKGRSFFDFSDRLMSSLMYRYIRDNPKIEDGIPPPMSCYEDEILGFESLVELGFAHVGDKGRYFLDGEYGRIVSNMLKTNMSSYETVNLRRAVKARIYEEIKKLGFSVIMDLDTTAIGIEGNEFAILDTSVFEDGINKSMSIEEVDDAEEYLYPDNGINEAISYKNQRQVVSKVLADKYGETTRKFEIEDV